MAADLHCCDEPRCREAWVKVRIDRTQTGYMWAIESPTNNFQATAPSDVPADDDPFIGTAELVRAGLYMRDGELGNLISGERRILERGDDGRPPTVELSGRDDKGRELNAHATIENTLRWWGYARRLDFWSLAKWPWDGHEAWGEHEEYHTFKQTRRLHELMTASVRS
jgi:hypothetical protein